MSERRSRNRIDLDDSSTRVWLILFLGVVMTGFGIAYAAATTPKAGGTASVPNDITSGLLSAVGGGIVGATISLLVTGSADRDTLRKIRSVVEDSLTSTLLSEESSLEPVRQTRHHYYVTTIKNRDVWRYERYHFDLSLGVSSVTVAISVKDASGRILRYRLEAGVRGDRLIIFSSMLNGQEPVFTEVYPQFVNYKSTHYGIVLMENWDGFNMLSKTILNSHDLLEGEQVEEGTVPERFFAQLDAAWEAGFAQHNRVLPSPGAATSVSLPESS